MIKERTILFACIAGFILIAGGCTDPKKDLPVAVRGTAIIHDAGWNDTVSGNFHGKVLKTKEYNLNTCVTCHAKSFNGGTSGVSCSRCHQSYPHKLGWKTDTSSAVFHGKFILSGQGRLDSCGTCHGSDFRGGTNSKSCYQCHTTYPHQTGWRSDSSSATFHGKYLLVDLGRTDSCGSCHGPDLEGGSSGVSCYSCHDNYPHHSTWTEEDSVGFHGKYLKDHGNQTNLCAPCHGSDLRGGTSGISCMTCHSTYPHQTGWANADSLTFHGKYLKTNDYDLTRCSSCHGSDFLGGSSGISCFSCHGSFPHATGWDADTSAVSFHGKYLQAGNWDATECTACHGSSYNGGTSSKACFTCHASFPHETKFIGDEGHERYMEDNGYPFAECKTCHGAGLTGGTRVDVSCSASGCHTDAASNAKSPEACNTCHGSFRGASADVVTWAPPQSLSGDTSTTIPGVGAHQKHLASGSIGMPVPCTECHTVPETVTAAGHIELPFNVQVVFNDTLAKVISADGPYTPVYHSPSMTCGNTFCHGNWKLRKEASGSQFAYSDTVMVGGRYAPLWTGGSAQSACGTTCHGLPPAGHLASAITGCSGCHSGVIDNTGAIIDRSKHINGKINVFGSERPFEQ